MESHIKYLGYVMRHKWFVFVAGIKIGAPLWRLIIHDWSKFSFAEWFPYVDNFYRDKKELQWDEWSDANSRYSCAELAPFGHWADERFKTAWLHHQRYNKHHWQYWAYPKDDGGLQVIPMPEKYALEMVADWAGAGRAISGEWEVVEWYKKNRDTIKIHAETRVIVEANLAAHYGYDLYEAGREMIEGLMREHFPYVKYPE
ncbi:MAG TPA: DUF5662 family protein [Hyphomicrobiales bacterium]|nr:DUF5662 family protein [Hyphomicrobiales bacterium]